MSLLGFGTGRACPAPTLVLLIASVAWGQTFDVRKFGAAGDGKTLNTSAFRDAVDAASAAGGGTVWVPAGKYLTGTIRLRDNITLWLDNGASVMGTPDVSQYETSSGADEWYKALILAKGAHHVAVMGHGTVDGNRVFNPKGEEHIRGPHAILFHDCTDVAVRDIHVQDAGNYAVILRSVQGIVVDGITVHGGWDGINMHDAKDAVISNCRLYTGDDSLAGAYWENVTVTNCILSSACNPVRVGGRNVLISNCVMYGPSEAASGTSLRHHTEAGFQILPQRSNVTNKFVKPGPVDNMVLSNNTMIRVRTPFFVAYSADAPYSGNNLGVNRIVVDGLTVVDAGRTPFYISAPPGNPARSIVLNRVRMQFTGGGSEAQAQGQGFSPFSILQSYAVYARNVDQLEMHDVRVDYSEPDTRPAIFGENIGTLELDRFQARREPNGAPFLEGAAIRRLIVDGNEAPAVPARVEGVDKPPAIVAGVPFAASVRVAGAAAEGFAPVPLTICGETQQRSVWLKPHETARVAFVNLRCPEGVAAAKPAGTEPGAPFLTFHNVAAELKQVGDGFYLKAAGDFTVMEYGDQYGAIYQPRTLAENGSVVVRMDNPDLRTNWVGRVGILVRTDITKPDRASGYVTLSSSPADGSYLEWDGRGKGRLDRHSEIEGLSIWPHWLRLERRGNRFTGYESADGVHWSQIAEAEVPGAAGPLDAGMFAYRSSAAFEHFAIENGGK
jgi:Pectate lyase superfamily protein